MNSDFEDKMKSDSKAKECTDQATSDDAKRELRYDGGNNVHSNDAVDNASNTKTRQTNLNNSISACVLQESSANFNNYDDATFAVHHHDVEHEEECESLEKNKEKEALQTPHTFSNSVHKSENNTCCACNIAVDNDSKLNNDGNTSEHWKDDSTNEQSTTKSGHDEIKSNDVVAPAQRVECADELYSAQENSWPVLLLSITSDDDDAIRTAQHLSSISILLPTLSETSIEIVGHEIKPVNSPIHVYDNQTTQTDDITNNIHSVNNKSNDSNNTESSSSAFANVKRNECSCGSKDNLHHSTDDESKCENESKPVMAVNKTLSDQEASLEQQQTTSHVIRKINLHQVVNAAPSHVSETSEHLTLPIDVLTSQLSDNITNTNNSNNTSVNTNRNTEASNLHQIAVASSKDVQNNTEQTSSSSNNNNNTKQQKASNITSSYTIHHQLQQEQQVQELHQKAEKMPKLPTLQMHNTQEHLSRQETQEHMPEQPSSVASSQSVQHSQSYSQLQHYTSLQQQQQRRYATRRLRNAPPSMDLPLALPISQSCCQTPLTRSTASASCFNNNNNNNNTEYLKRSKSFIFDGGNNNGNSSSSARWRRSTQRECRSCEQESHHSIHSLIRGLRQGSIREIFPHLNPLFILPRERIFVYRSTSKQLGKGAYGVVMYGELYPPPTEQQESTPEIQQQEEYEQIKEKCKKKELNIKYSKNSKNSCTMESKRSNTNEAKPVQDISITQWLANGSAIDNNNMSSHSNGVNDFKELKHEVNDDNSTYNSENKETQSLTSSSNATHVKNERLAPLLPLPPQPSLSPSSMELHSIINTTSPGITPSSNRYHITSFPSAPSSHHHHDERSLSHNNTRNSTHSSSHSSTTSFTFNNHINNNIISTSNNNSSRSSTMKSERSTPMHLMPYSELTASFYSRQSHSCNASRAVTPVKCNTTRATSEQNANIFTDSNHMVMGDVLSRQHSNHIEYNNNNSNSSSRKDASAISSSSNNNVRHATLSLPASVHSSSHVSVVSELSVCNTSNCVSKATDKSANNSNKGNCISFSEDNPMDIDAAAICMSNDHNSVNSSRRNVSCGKTDSDKLIKPTFSETPLTIPLAQIKTSQWHHSLLGTEDHARNSSVVSRSTTFSSAERSTNDATNTTKSKSNSWHNDGGGSSGKLSNNGSSNVLAKHSSKECHKTYHNTKNSYVKTNKHVRESVSDNTTKENNNINTLETRSINNHKVNTHDVSSSDNEEGEEGEDDEAYMDENMSPVSALSPEFSTLCDVSLSRSSPSPIVLPIMTETSLHNVTSKNVLSDNHDKSTNSDDNNNEKEAITTKINSDSKCVETEKEEYNKVADDDDDVERDNNHTNETKDFLTEAKMTMASANHDDISNSIAAAANDADFLETKSCCEEKKGICTSVSNIQNSKNLDALCTCDTNTSITSDFALASFVNKSNATSSEINHTQSERSPQQNTEQSDENMHNSQGKDLCDSYFANSKQEKADSAIEGDNAECKGKMRILPPYLLLQETASYEETHNKDNNTSNESESCKLMCINDKNLLASSYCEAKITSVTGDKEKKHIHVPDLHRTEETQILPNRQTDSLIKAATSLPHYKTSLPLSESESQQEEEQKAHSTKIASQPPSSSEITTTHAEILSTQATNMENKSDQVCTFVSQLHNNNVFSIDGVKHESNSKNNSQHINANNTKQNDVEKCEATNKSLDMKRCTSNDYNNQHKNWESECKTVTSGANKALSMSTSETAMSQSSNRISKHSIHEGCIPFHAVAVKVVCKTDLMRPVFDEAVHNEVHMASHLHHPCLINYFGITEDAENLLLVMDLSENGNLKEYQTKFGVAKTREMAPRFMADIVLALEYFRDEVQHPFSPRSTPINSAASAHSMFANRCNNICFSANTCSSSSNNNNNNNSVPFTEHTHHFSRTNHLPLSKSLFDLSALRSQHSARRRERSLEHSYHFSRSINQDSINNNNDDDDNDNFCKNTISIKNSNTVNVNHVECNKDEDDNQNGEQHKTKYTHDQSEPSCDMHY